MRYLLDTNICIYLIKRSPPAVIRRFQKLRVGDMGVSAITFCELQFGVANSAKPKQNQLALMGFLAPLEVRDFPAAAGAVYGEVRAHLQRKGTPVGNYDLLIGAHALHEGLTLVTNNTREFKRIPNLKVENWAR
ncbi:MAG: tRNA(fMet)-specific endonuclease VapC [Limisphaerales bacterium]|jgi:tRNA(fMet)-specific endonuclease VapC